METQVKSYRDLIAWRKAMKLTVCVYKSVSAFPKDELYDELETQILLAQALGYADETASLGLLEQAAEVGRVTD